MRSRRSGWILALFLIVGSFLGGLLGTVVGEYLPFLNWASPTYGINPPLVVNLDMFSLTFGFTLQLSVAGVVGLIIAYLAYRAL
jgi:hypothetical protein